MGFIWVPAHMDVEGNEGGRSRGKKVSSTGEEKNRDGFSTWTTFSPINKASRVESVNVEKEKM